MTDIQKMELIDRTKLEPHQIYDEDGWVEVVYMDDIREMPTVEAEQVKLGKWLDREHAPWGQVYETCSVCLQRQTLDEGLDHFCPLCGAKMNSYKRKMDGRG